MNHKDADLVHKLIKQGADIKGVSVPCDISDKNKTVHPLCHAVMLNHADFVQMFIEKGVTPAQCSLVAAALAGSPRLFHNSLNGAPKLSMTATVSLKLLYVCSNSIFFRLITEMIENGILSRPSVDGFALLMHTAIDRRSQLRVRRLLQRGFDPNYNPRSKGVESTWVFSELFSLPLAVRLELSEIVKDLITSGVDVNGCCVINGKPL